MQETVREGEARSRREVRIDLFEDPGETTDVSARHPGVRAELESALDDWFADLWRSSPHAFGAPIHRVTSDEVVIQARTPSRIFGAMQNTVALIHGWQTPGSGAAYQLQVSDAAPRVVGLVWGVPPAPGTVLEVSIAGSPVALRLEGPSWRTADPLDLPSGPVVLLLRVITAPTNAGEAGLSEVRLRRSGS